MSIVDTAKDVYELAKKGATSELQEELIKMREEALSLQEENLELRRRITELESQQNLAASLNFDGAKYWKAQDGQREGPFCQQCYDTGQIMVKLQDASYHDGDRQVEYRTCLTCKSGYS